MDFIDGLPASQGMNTIMVVVDCLTKYAHFISISHPNTTSHIADVFVKEILRLYEMPRTIASDHDPIFINHFWKSFFKLHGTQLCRSGTYHCNPTTKPKSLMALWSITCTISQLTNPPLRPLCSIEQNGGTIPPSKPTSRCLIFRHSICTL